MSDLPPEPSEPVPMRVGGLVVDPNTQVPVVILRGVAEPRLYLPIFIGGLEATAIASVLASVKMPRPMTHDLMATLLDAVQCRVARVAVTRLEAGTFFAEITLADASGGELVLDARPSDALAIALRTDAPISVHPAVLAEAGALAPEDEMPTPPAPAGTEPEAAPTPAPPKPDDDEGPQPVPRDAKLEDLGPEMFGKYKM